VILGVRNSDQAFAIKAVQHLTNSLLISVVELKWNQHRCIIVRRDGQRQTRKTRRSLGETDLSVFG
jgi:hypothetical protein